MNIIRTLTIVSLLLIISLAGCSAAFPGIKCRSYIKPVTEKTGSVLLVVAHQDDDVFIASRLKQHIEVGDKVFIVWVAKSYQEGELYAETRIEEAKEAIKYLGLDSTSYKFLNYPDARTFNYTESIIRDLEKVIRCVQPKIVYIQAYEGGNIDHDVSHFCTVQIIKETDTACEIFEFPEYSAHNKLFYLPFEMRSYPDTIITHCRKLSNDEVIFVNAYWDIYKSQHFPIGFYIKFIGQKERTFGYEFLRKLPEYNYLQPPLGLTPAYESYIPGVTFEDFYKSVKNYLERSM